MRRAWQRRELALLPHMFEIDLCPLHSEDLRWTSMFPFTSRRSSLLQLPSSMLITTTVKSMVQSMTSTLKLKTRFNGHLTTHRRLERRHKKNSRKMWEITTVLDFFLSCCHATVRIVSNYWVDSTIPERAEPRNSRALPIDDQKCCAAGKRTRRQAWW